MLVLGAGRSPWCGRAGAPALFPLRLLATVFTDVFRGVPSILRRLPGRLRDPGARAHRAADRPGGARRHRPDALLHAPTSPRSTAPGSTRSTRSQRDAALAIGLTERQALRYVVAAAGGAPRGPPLLNDFISLQKDVALSRSSAPQEAFRVAQIIAASKFNYTPLLAAALLYLAVTVPLARIVDRQQAARGGARGTRCA